MALPVAPYRSVAARREILAAIGLVLAAAVPTTHALSTSAPVSAKQAGAAWQGEEAAAEAQRTANEAIAIACAAGACAPRGITEAPLQALGLPDTSAQEAPGVQPASGGAAAGPWGEAREVRPETVGRQPEIAGAAAGSWAEARDVRPEAAAAAVGGEQRPRAEATVWSILSQESQSGEGVALDLQIGVHPVSTTVGLPELWNEAREVKPEGRPPPPEADPAAGQQLREELLSMEHSPGKMSRRVKPEARPPPVEVPVANEQQLHQEVLPMEHASGKMSRRGPQHEGGQALDVQIGVRPVTMELPEDWSERREVKPEAGPHQPQVAAAGEGQVHEEGPQDEGGQALDMQIGVRRVSTTMELPEPWNERREVKPEGGPHQPQADRLASDVQQSGEGPQLPQGITPPPDEAFKVVEPPVLPLAETIVEGGTTLGPALLPAAQEDAETPTTSVRLQRNLGEAHEALAAASAKSAAPSLWLAGSALVCALMVLFLGRPLMARVRTKPRPAVNKDDPLSYLFEAQRLQRTS